MIANRKGEEVKRYSVRINRKIIKGNRKSKRMIKMRSQNQKKVSLIFNEEIMSKGQKLTGNEVNKLLNPN